MYEGTVDGPLTEEERDVTRRCRDFYEQCHFPGNRPLDHDGLILTRRFASSVARCAREKKGKQIRVLDAGCGTGNTSIALARQYKNVEFVGLDNSAASLEKARQEAERQQIRNLSFLRWDLMNPVPYDGKLDIVLCLGVLHHTANMARALCNLRNCLDTWGDLYLWIYGRHGRHRHSLNVRLLAMLLGTGARTAAASDLAMEFAFNVDNGAPLDDLLGRNRLDPMHRLTLEDPVWIADQFLNPHETLLDLEELTGLATACGLEIEQLLGIRDDLSSYFNSAALYGRFRKLSGEDRLIALDLLLKPERYFVLLRNRSGLGA
jgi:SAM-dependent methyltransferase